MNISLVCFLPYWRGLRKTRREKVVSTDVLTPVHRVAIPL
jgi:hypothetical protein